MTAFYNEIDPFAAQWLRNLISAGEIPPGVVDERSIRDIRPSELAGYAQCHFFAGIGGWGLAARLAGWPDGRPLWTGSCPCQPHSRAASGQQRGFRDERDLWPVWLDLIRECRPNVLAGEQVDDSDAWIDRAVADLEAEGFAVGSLDLPACAVDAPQERMRHYFVADADGARFEEPGRPVTMGPAYEALERSSRRSFFGDGYTTGELGRNRRTKPGLPLLADGVPGAVGRLRAYGNAIVPGVAAELLAAFLDLEAPARPASVPLTLESCP